MATYPLTPRDGTVWLTGASSGIGEAVALKLARRGWTVLATARRPDALEALAARAGGGSGGRIVPAPGDVTDPDAMAALVDRAYADHGPIALALLNAGTFSADGIEPFDLEGFRKTVDINVKGTANCVAPLLPRWIDRHRGHLAVVSSVAGYTGLPTAIAYGATKAALINFCESIKFDFDRKGLKIQVINPGFVRTPLTEKNPFPMPFLLEVDDAADRILRGLQRRSFEITFPRRFTCALKLLRVLPYGLYFPLVHRATGK
jgi:NAD(P)-dependent dehydrogenase (short-subunit alcohol dehydrogenase family)